jgi:bifunctional pyridoxal-dependent enzyme with beta-cystathionase and maltose regulon repressor activities
LFFASITKPGMAAGQLAVTGSAALVAAAVLLWRWRRWRKQCWVDFEALPDRSRVHSVKHELPTALFGEAADGALQMWVADMELPCCPRIQRALMERAAHPTFGYTIQPHEAWAEAGRWLVKQQGWPYAPDPSSFVFAASAVTGFCTVLESLTEPGDSVVVMTPLCASMHCRAQTPRTRRLLPASAGTRRCSAP